MERQDKNDLAILRFQSNVYDMDTIKKAAYRFTDVAAFDLLYENDTSIICTISALKSDKKIVIADVMDAFKNEVLDQDLRKKISEETAPIRTVMLAYVFSRTGLQGE
jgi:His-Xaa-Ser system protein HxsD